MDELTKLQCAEAEIEALKAQVEQLQDKIFELQCFDVDVLRCLKTLAYEHNHADIPRYQTMAKKCMEKISAGNKAEELKTQVLEVEYNELLHAIEYQYDGNSSSEWSIGANYVCKLLKEEVWKRSKNLSKAAKVGE